MLMLIRNIFYFLLSAVVALYTLAAFAADCSESRIRSLAEKGQTIHAISEKCDVSTSYVKHVIKNDSDSDSDLPSPRPDNHLAPSGTAVSPCGCYGNAYQGAQIPDNRCQSGTAVVSFCNAMCSAGGYMWQTYCQ
ncbi:putative LysM domain-containing protein [Pseudomonas chlororaphis]